MVTKFCDLVGCEVKQTADDCCNLIYYTKCLCVGWSELNMIADIEATSECDAWQFHFIWEFVDQDRSITTLLLHWLVMPCPFSKHNTALFVRNQRSTLSHLLLYITNYIFADMITSGRAMRAEEERVCLTGSNFLCLTGYNSFIHYTDTYYIRNIRTTILHMQWRTFIEP